MDFVSSDYSCVNYSNLKFIAPRSLSVHVGVYFWNEWKQYIYKLCLHRFKIYILGNVSFFVQTAVKWMPYYWCITFFRLMTCSRTLVCWGFFTVSERWTVEIWILESSIFFLCLTVFCQKGEVLLKNSKTNKCKTPQSQMNHLWYQH